MDHEDKYYSNLEQLYVHNVYESMSSHYEEFFDGSSRKSQTDGRVNRTNNNDVNGGKKKKSFRSRQVYRAWPKVKKFIRKLEPDSLLADVGCGEGKYLNLNNRILSIGSDRSSSLCQLAANSQQASTNGNQLVVCDNLTLPFRSGLFDAVISIGVIHHLSSAKRRIRAVQELNRILRPGGKIMIYVWAMEQLSRTFNSQDVLVPLLNTKPAKKPQNAHENLQRNLSNKSVLSGDEPCEDSEFQLSNDAINEITEGINSLKYTEDENDVFKSSSSETTNSKSDHSSLETFDPPTSPVEGPNFQLMSKNEGSFVDSLKTYLSRKFSLKKKCEQATPNSASHFSFDFFEQYKKIFESHKQILPRDFTIRQFPRSSCEDTFNDEDNMNHLNEDDDTNTDLNDCLANEEERAEEDVNNNDNKRFYHVFKQSELDDLIRENCPGLVIYDSYYDHGNWCICASKENSRRT